MHSPAPQDTGTQPGHSSTRSWDTARAELYRDLGCRELVGRNVHKSRKKQSGHTRSCWSIPFSCPSGKKIKSLCGKSSITCKDLQDGHWKKDLGDTAATKDEKRGHVDAHQFLTGTGLKWKASRWPSTSNWSMNMAANWEQSWLPPLHLRDSLEKHRRNLKVIVKLYRTQAERVKVLSLHHDKQQNAQMLI